MENARPHTSETSALEQRHFNPAADLFPNTLPPVVPAKWPKPGTITADVLDTLHTRPTTQADYDRSWRLAAYIGHLERLGWRFLRRNVKRLPYRTAITEYSLDFEDPATAAAIASRQRGSIDPSLAGLLAFAGLCVMLLACC